MVDFSWTAIGFGVFATVVLSVTAEECAKYLGLSRSAIYKLTHRKEIPHFKPSKRVMFKRSEVDAWIQKSYVPTK